MNSSKPQIKNFLFTSFEKEDRIKDFVEIAASLIAKNKIVLLFIRKHVDFMSILAGLSKIQMQNFIISYHSDIKGVIEKLLELHDWVILPDLVILNLDSYYDGEDEVPSFKTVCFCISSLLSYMNSVEKRRTVQQDVKSVTLLNAHSGVQIQLLIDFYFYKMEAFRQLMPIKCEILK